MPKRKPPRDESVMDEQEAVAPLPASDEPDDPVPNAESQLQRRKYDERSITRQLLSKRLFGEERRRSQPEFKRPLAPDFSLGSEDAARIMNKLSNYDIDLLGQRLSALPIQFLRAVGELAIFTGAPFWLEFVYLSADLGLDINTSEIINNSVEMNWEMIQRSLPELEKSDLYRVLSYSVENDSGLRRITRGTFRATMSVLYVGDLNEAQRRDINLDIVKEIKEWVQATPTRQVIEGLPDEGAGGPMADNKLKENATPVFEGELSRLSFEIALKEIMSERKLSFRAAAAAAGVSPKTIQRISDQEMTLDKSSEIFEALGYEVQVKVVPKEPL